MTHVEIPPTVSAHWAAPKLLSAWQCCAQPPGAALTPALLNHTAADWFPATAPGTVAQALQAQGRWQPDAPPEATFEGDEKDWWYATTFAAPDLPVGQSCELVFEGLATIAEVWLNGQHILTAENMFRRYRVDVTNHLQPNNDLVIAFRSLRERLHQRRPRPRWKTNLVNHQQLRWQRTTLLGRIPGWSPPITAVGPWRAIWLDARPVRLTESHLNCAIEHGTGGVTFRAQVQTNFPLEQAVLCAGTTQTLISAERNENGWRLTGRLSIPDPPLWFPHTHGAPELTDCTLQLTAGGTSFSFSLGRIGFRSLEVSQENGFALRVNGVPLYCRGACWTVSDITTLDGAADSLAHDLRLAREAGVNLLRIGGTMIYESDRFYELCDELGILVWQDFMFANMDYPVTDAGFAAEIEAEAVGELKRLARHPSLAVYCGNSEVEQQAAMLGMSADLQRNDWFAERLPRLCAEYHPGTAYVPSSPSGGAMPFHVGEGIAHYYGVGAYLRSPRELRQANVKFATECLGFANLPEMETLSAITGGALPTTHHPRWKARVPRDTGSGWDFEDVRDFYLQELFGVDPVRLRSFDMPRYLQLSSVVPGEMMARVFAEWRSTSSHNRGGLVWFYKDLWPATGWGILDNLGLPKAAYYYLRRSWQPQQITLTDEGLDGLHLHLVNETAQPLRATAELLLLKDGQTPIARKEAPCEIPPRSAIALRSEDVLGQFFDVNYAYRFGPPKHDVVIATLYDEARAVLSEAFYFPCPGTPTPTDAEVNIHVTQTGDEQYQLALSANRFLQSVNFDLSGFLPDDNYFHLAPHREKTIHFRRFKNQAKKFSGYIAALNLKEPIKFAWQSTHA